MQRLGDVSAAYVWQVLQQHRIQLQRHRSWCVSTDQALAPKVADIVGCYLDPPEQAMVLCVGFLWWKDARVGADRLTPRDIVTLTFPVHQPPGHEQEGSRPAVIVGVATGPTRFPVVVVVPLTTQAREWTDHNPTLYPQLDAGSGGLIRPSVALLDQVRAVDAGRLATCLGTLSRAAYAPIHRGLSMLFADL